MTKFKLLKLPLAFAIALVGGSALADGDATAGKKVFKKCQACHALEAGKKKIGPSLHGIFGRKAGSVDGFKFSKAMKASDIVWDEENMDKFLAKPKTVLPGTRMVFAGLKKDDQRKNLIAYLMQATR
ncbi:MAG: cytochrome c family protein [Rhodospirillales bacterium]|nr:cytochrome c family protein [Rhodospirillales bacterium]MDH3911124.1 cytochrome c family protein [Rhodospirillales bacterium]MDH3918123.1 cytochrome c family protein [Rhodospirillales bacterium]MDH3967080.1 cytochrome c family protein [Rhodospirillales bacterium]